MAEGSDDSFQLRSPEGVALELPISGPGSRILAYAIDYIAIVAIAILVVLAASFPISESISSWIEEVTNQLEENPNDAQALNALLLPIIVLMMVVVGFGEMLYFTVWEIASGGRSLGKMVVKLRVIERDGMPLTCQSSVIRNVLRFVDVLPSSYTIGLLSIILTGRNQRLGDLASGTVVIRSDAYEPAVAVATDPRIQPLPLSREQLQLLGVAELSLARGALRRNASVSNDRAKVVLDEAVAISREKLMLEADSSSDAKRFLERLVVTAERNDRRQ